MQPRTPKLLEDVRDAAAFIVEVVRGRSLADYRSNRLLRQVIERHFEIIGQAIKRVTQDDPESAARIGDHRPIIAFRTVLLHGYDLVDHALVWNTIGQKLPTALCELTELLASADGSA